MKRVIIKAGFITGAIILALAAFVGIYFLAAWLFSRMAVEQERVQGRVPVYLLTNGVHTDLVMPVKTPVIDWNTLFPYINTTGKDTTSPYIAIGWGDKGFYLNTPTWDDLTFGTAFNAVFGLSTTAVHATYHTGLQEGSDCRRLMLSEDQYLRLVQYIRESLVYENGAPLLIETNANYGTTDAFYEAKGTYSLFRTCNTWTNSALKKCGQKACVWTPFQSGIFYQYSR